MTVLHDQKQEFPVPEQCFLCGSAFNAMPSIFWQGTNASTRLHPACANYLSSQMFSDYLKAITGGALK